MIYFLAVASMSIAGGDLMDFEEEFVSWVTDENGQDAISYNLLLILVGVQQISHYPA